MTETKEKVVKKEKITKQNPLSVSVFNMKGEAVGEFELPKELFGTKVNKPLLAQAVRVYLANQRGMGGKTKTRAEVAGGGAKPWRQKGTGRARAGSIRSPLWRGGGIVHGPLGRDFSLELPKKMKKEALKSALSAKAEAKQVTILDKLELKEEKTKLANQVLKTLPVKNKIFLVVSETNGLKKAFRNLPKVDLADYKSLNTYEVLNHDSLVFTREAVENLEKIYVK